jgi:hypothetical protein
MYYFFFNYWVNNINHLSINVVDVLNIRLFAYHFFFFDLRTLYFTLDLTEIFGLLRAALAPTIVHRAGIT